MTDPEILSFFKTTDPLLFPHIESLDCTRLTPDTRWSLFYQLCQTIIGQQLSGKAANTIENRFRALFKSELEPSPQQILSISPDLLRGAGLSWAKVRSVVDLSERVVKKLIDLESLPLLSDEVVIQQLKEVKGIGQWTAEMVLLFTFGREDVFSSGDLGLKKGIQIVYTLPKLPTELEALEISKKWQPYRSYASLTLWHAVDSQKKQL